MSFKKTSENSRRNFLSASLLATFGLTNLNFIAKNDNLKTIKPAALKKGDTIGLVCPAYSAFIKEEVTIAVESLQAMGFKVLQGKHIFDRYGKLIKQIFPSREGWDGTFRGKRVQQGVYVFYAEVEVLPGKTVILKGDITVLY